MTPTTHRKLALAVPPTAFAGALLAVMALPLDKAEPVAVGHLTPAPVTTAVPEPETTTTVLQVGRVSYYATTTTQAPTTTSAPVRTTQPPKRVVPVSEPTTTTKAPESTTAAKRTPLDVARGELGKRGSYADDDYWCHKLVNFAVGTKFDGPSDAARLPRVTDPRPGDVILLQLDPKHEPDGQTSHVGLVESISASEVVSLERNPSSVGDDVVVRVSRSRDDSAIVGFGRQS